MIAHTRLKTQSKADLVPMIDVVFQLVIFFMISSVFNVAPGIALQLPESETSDNIPQTPLIVTVVSNEECYVNKDLGTLEELPLMLQNQEYTGKSVILQGNSQLPYQLLITAMDKLRLAGFESISLKTIEKGVP